MKITFEVPENKTTDILAAVMQILGKPAEEINSKKEDKPKAKKKEPTKTKVEEPLEESTESAEKIDTKELLKQIKQLITNNGSEIKKIASEYVKNKGVKISGLAVDELIELKILLEGELNGD